MHIFSTAIKAFILPPGLFIVLLVLGLCLFRWRKLSFALIAIATLGLYLLSLVPVASWLAQSLQYYPALTDQAIAKAQAQAIVVLSAGRYKNPLEYNKHDKASMYEIMRLQYAAYLQRKTHLPILDSGGFCLDKDSSEASVMAQTLRDDFNVPTRWTENQSEDTWQNAKYSVAMLRAHNIKRAFIVTQAIHMPRSMLSFKHFGFDAVAAPTYFFPKDSNYFSLLPNFEALNWNVFSLYEYFGLVLYKMRCWLDF